MTNALDRRSFLGRGALLAGGGVLSVSALERLSAREALAAPDDGARPQQASYGPLERKPDQRGREILALPAGFSYVTFGEIGSTMSDGNPTPIALDGMAAFPGPGGTVRLIRNHEDRNPPGQGSLGGDPRTKYDPEGGGGTTTLDYDPRARRLVRDFISLNGTAVNCAGGVAFGHRAWISCEEDVGGPEHADAALRFPRRHGYCFEVPLVGRPSARPIKAMGRFAHEAVAADQRTGIVYETEDPGSGRGAGFYRYLPRDPRRLSAGGRLQILAVTGAPQYDTREGQTVGRKLPVSWIDIPDPDPAYANLDDPGGVFKQGFALGAAKFNRVEGCWYDAGSVFFCATSGGDAKNGDVNSDGFREGYGQVWEYRAHDRSDGLLVLHYESPGGSEVDSPDNLTVTPRGGLVLCEDDAGDGDGDTHPLAPGLENVNRLIGLSPAGQAFEFGVNVLNGSEFAGACFSPGGETLFMNLFGRARATEEPLEGMTCAITGPWETGPL